MRLKLFISLFFLATLYTSGQTRYIIKPKQQSKAEGPITKVKPTDLSIDLNRLAQNITKTKSSDPDKARAIFLWITTHISYDYELKLNKPLQKKIYTSKENVLKNVLQRKKALCGGLAFLFQELCKYAEVEAQSIHGFTKTTTNFQKPNHTWNAVKLSGKWQLLDITWALSVGNTNQPNTQWYLTNPNTFIKSHFPQNPDWALLANPPSFSSFIRNP